MDLRLGVIDLLAKRDQIVGLDIFLFDFSDLAQQKSDIVLKRIALFL